MALRQLKLMTMALTAQPPQPSPTSSPAISVVMPVYNVERYVEQSIKSVLNQKFRDFELIIVDDASPDRSIEICQRAATADARIKIVRHDRNRGLGAARNTGMDHARGKYIYFIDSDDLLLDNALTIMHAAADQNNVEVLHASSYFERVERADGSFDAQLIEKQDKAPVNGWLTKDRNARLANCFINYNFWSMAWLNFCRRDFLERHNLRFPSMLSEDEPFAIALYCLADRFACIPHKLYVYNRRRSSLTGSKGAERASKAIGSMVEGHHYIMSVMARLSKDQVTSRMRNEVVQSFFSRMIENYILPFYDLENITSAEAIQTFADGLSPKVEQSDWAAHLMQAYIIQRLKATAARRELSRLNKSLTATNNETKSPELNETPIDERKIIFINFNGKGYGCNPKYIAEEIIRRKLSYDLVWLVSDMNEPMPKEIRKVRFGSPDAERELETARVFVTNIKNSPPFHKRPGQFLIMTWHDSLHYGIFKDIEHDAEAQLNPRYVAVSKLNSKLTDLMLSPNAKSTAEIPNLFWYDGEILESGMPRTDILFNADCSLIDRVKSRLGVPTTNRIMLYAPTFRDKPEDNLSACRLDFDRLLKVLKKKFRGEWTLMIRFHPNVARYNLTEQLVALSDKILDATHYPDVQELIAASDMVITDYSGIALDFMLMHKPVFLYATDIDTYPKERGLKQSYFDLPLAHNRTEEELFSCIARYDEKVGRERIDKFISTFNSFNDGHASTRVVDRIVEVISKPVKSVPR